MMSKLELSLLLILLGTILALAMHANGLWDRLWPVGVTQQTIIERSAE